MEGPFGPLSLLIAPRTTRQMMAQDHEMRMALLQAQQAEQAAVAEQNRRRLGAAGVPSESPTSISVPMRREGSTYTVPVLINGALTLDFILDTGASDVSIPADVVLTLIRTGTISSSDFLGKQTYVLADGSEVPSETFRIRSLKVGNKTIENVTARVASIKGKLLLGQSFLGRFKSWSIDNSKHSLVLD
jgi:clan AA aspartic protease (TIGR02281 family)